MAEVEHCHVLDLSEKPDGEWQLMARWHRTVQGESLVPSFTGSGRWSESDTARPTGLDQAMGAIQTRAQRLIEAHEEHRWADLGITGIKITNIYVRRYAPPARDIGIQIKYERLDAEGAPIPHWGGNLIYEYRDVGERGDNPPIWELSVNSDKAFISDEQEQTRVVGACEAMLTLAKNLAEQAERKGGRG